MLYTWVMVKLRRSSIEVRSLVGQFLTPDQGPACRLPLAAEAASVRVYHVLLQYTTSNDLPHSLPQLFKYLAQQKLQYTTHETTTKVKMKECFFFESILWIPMSV